MRKLTDDSQEELNLRKQKDELEKELVDLGNRIDENKQAIDQTNNRIDDIVNSDTCNKQYAQHEQADIGNLYVKNDTTIDNDLTVNNNITANSISIEDLKTNTSTINKIINEELKTKDIESETISTGSFISNSIQTEAIETNDIKSNTGEFNDLNINNAHIENFEIVHSISEDLTTENATINDTITAPKAKLSDIAAEILRSDIARLDKIQTHNINFDNEPDNPYYIHIEPQDQPSETDYRIIEVPYCDTGEYIMTLRDPKTDISWWSVVVRNNNSNITVSYSRRTTDLQGNPMVNPTLSQFYVYDFEGQAPQLYIKTYVGGNLYWQNQSLRERPSPVMWNWYPFDISSFGALKYDVLHRAATWYTNHIDLRNGQSVGQASLFLIPSDWNNATKQQVEYDTSRDIPYRYYIPDQSVNTTDEVTFAELIIEPLEGRWVYSVESALKGRDPVLITDGSYGSQEYDTNGTPKPVIGDPEAGQLNEYPWVIETQELAKWNGKTGVRVNTDEIIDGTIYRDQAWIKENQYLYHKVNIDDYDVTLYEDAENNPTTVNNVLVYRRKMDTVRGKKYDLVVSAPYVKTEYEDDDQIVWDCYTYTFYGEYPEGLMYTKWLEREVEGKLVSRILESTVDSDEYITHVVGFKEPFSYGNTILRSYSFENYKKDLQYLGDVVEGRWNAGELYAHKKNVDPKSSDYTGTDYDYTGNLTVDGKTKLKDSITIVNDYDNTDIKPVEEIKIEADTFDQESTDIKIVTKNYDHTSTNSNIEAENYSQESTNVELTTENYEETIKIDYKSTIGSEDNPATITKTITGDSVIDNMGTVAITNKGDTNIDNEGPVTITNNGNIDFTTASKTTYTGPSNGPVHENTEAKENDYELQLTENVAVGDKDNERDLRVTGRLYVNEIELDCDDNKILYKEDNKLKTVNNSFIGNLNKLPNDLSNGSLVIEVE